MQDLNLRPLGPKPSALPNCANRRHLSFARCLWALSRYASQMPRYKSWLTTEANVTYKHAERQTFFTK